MKTKQKEIYDEVLFEEPEDTTMETKEYKTWEKRLHNSIGWIWPFTTARFYINDKDKPVGDGDDKDIIWNVENECGSMDFKNQENAVIYSEMMQIKAKLNRQFNKDEKVIKS